MRIEELRVGAEEEEIRLDRWFRRHFPGLTQGTIERLCRSGQVRVDGGRVHGATRLRPGQVVRVPVVFTPEAPAPAQLPDPRLARQLLGRILYQDDSILILDKPAGLAVQGGPGIGRHLDGQLEALRLGFPERPRLVHRLDKETAGCLVLARTRTAAVKLARAFRGREAEKLYWAVVIGCPTPASGTVELALTRKTDHRSGSTTIAEGWITGAKVTGRANSLPAVTAYATRERVGKRFAWLELSPETGRTHQLRVHCLALGTPILGDVAHAAEREAGFHFGKGLHLLARRLELPHPEGGRIRVEAALPAHMAATFQALGLVAPAPLPPARLDRDGGSAHPRLARTLPTEGGR